NRQSLPWIPQTGRRQPPAHSFRKRSYPRFPAGFQRRPCPARSTGRTSFSTGPLSVAFLPARGLCASPCREISACILFVFVRSSFSFVLLVECVARSMMRRMNERGQDNYFAF